MIADIPILAIVLPLLGGFISPVVGIIAGRVGRPRIRDYFALVIAGATFGLMLYMAKSVILEGEILVYHLAGRLPPWGINLAVDGLSVLAGLIATGMTFLVVMYSIGFMEDEKGLDKYYLLLLVMCAGMVGVSFTGDIFNLYVFFEIMSITSYGLVAFFRSGKSVEGAFKYLVMGTVGTVSILMGVTLVYGLGGTLNIADLSVRLTALSGAMENGFPLSGVIALGLFITGFGVKIGMVPLHAWKPDAYQAAPSAVSAVLAGGVIMVGVSAMLRVSYLLFNVLSVGYVFVALGLATMILGGFMAVVQDDLKRLLAYSSISQMGYTLLAVGLGTALSMKGGMFHFLNNAIYKGLLFLCAGAVVLRVGTSRMDELGGLGKKMPVTAFAFAVGAIALSGIPPLNGFASKWMIYVACIDVGRPILTVIAVVISAITLAYLLKAFSMVFLGPLPDQFEGVKEAPASMLVPMVALTSLCILFGVFPQLGIGVVKPGQETLMNHLPYLKEVLGGALP